jgi:hypothetical protein
MSADPPKALIPPPPLVAVAGWLIPGLGYWLIGQKARGATIGFTILSMFVAGLLIGGVRTVDSTLIESADQRKERLTDDATRARDVEEHNRRAPDDKQPPYRPPSLLARVLQKPWFIGQAMAGPIAIASGYVGVTWGGPGGAPYSHARVYEIGVLYTAVAGMLNLMAVIDAAYRASNEGAR